MDSSKLPDVNVIIKPEFIERVLRRDLGVMRIELDAMQEFVLLIYAKLYEKTIEEAKKEYEGIFEQAHTRWKLSVAKYSDLTKPDQPPARH